jgi:hypothetical protein
MDSSTLYRGRQAERQRVTNFRGGLDRLGACSVEKLRLIGKWDLARDSTAECRPSGSESRKACLLPAAKRVGKLNERLLNYLVEHRSI